MRTSHLEQESKIVNRSVKTVFLCRLTRQTTRRINPAPNHLSMSDKQPNTDDARFRSIAEQLSRPQGEAGHEMAEMMHRTNIQMTLRSIEALELSGAGSLLELGHGNGGHIDKVLKLYPQLRYSGLEISGLMKEEAEAGNREAIVSGRANFRLYEGSQLPFDTDSFDRVLTVNTLYFWKDPAGFLRELLRVLRPGGYLAVTFGDKAFMERLPFTRYVFKLYNPSAFSELAQGMSYRGLSFYSHEDEVESKTGETVRRPFHIARMQK